MKCFMSLQIYQKEVRRQHLCNAVRYKLPSGQFSFKKVTTVAQERFTIGNMAYTQLYVDYLYGKDLYTLKYFDNCGIKLANPGSRNYGHQKLEGS